MAIKFVAQPLLQHFSIFMKENQNYLSVRNVLIVGEINFADTDWSTLISSDEEVFLGESTVLIFIKQSPGKKDVN